MYFRPAERRSALECLASALAPTGYLLVGHSESLRDAPDLFAPDRRYAVGVYRPSQAMSAREETPTERPAREPAAPARAAAGQRACRGGPRILRLEGDYDADRRPEKLESLKQRLGEAIDERCDVVLEADGATMLDQTTARLIARAARHAASHGRRLVLRASREAVVRWASRHGLPLSPAAAGEAGLP
jgi:anti-anti-sigma regulatory factor